MRPPTIGLLVLGKSDAELIGFLDRSPHARAEARLRLVSNPDKRLGGYAAVANPFLDSAIEDVTGVVHADTTFALGAIALLGEAAASGSMMTGLVGRGLDGAYVWGKDGGGKVSTLDSCSCFFAASLGLRFDGRMFDDFHCCVEDLCLQALAREIESFVPAVEADHIGHINRPGNWMTNYRRYRNRLSRKWQHVRFMTT